MSTIAVFHHANHKQKTLQCHVDLNWNYVLHDARGIDEIWVLSKEIGIDCDKKIIIRLHEAKHKFHKHRVNLKSWTLFVWSLPHDRLIWVWSGFRIRETSIIACRVARSRKRNFHSRIWVWLLQDLMLKIGNLREICSLMKKYYIIRSQMIQFPDKKIENMEIYPNCTNEQIFFGTNVLVERGWRAIAYFDYYTNIFIFSTVLSQKACVKAKILLLRDGGSFRFANYFERENNSKLSTVLS